MRICLFVFDILQKQIRKKVKQADFAVLDLETDSFHLCPNEAKGIRSHFRDFCTNTIHSLLVTGYHLLITDY